MSEVSTRKRIVNRRIDRTPPPVPEEKPVVRKRIAGRSSKDLGMGDDVVQLDPNATPILTLMSEQPKNNNLFRAGEYLHVSDMLNKCVRQIALSEKHMMPMPANRLSEWMSLTFRVGEAIHDFIKEKFVSANGARLYGRWRCACKHTVTENMLLAQVPKIKCEKCGMVPSIYDECRVTNEEAKVVGHADIMLLFDDGYYYPVEIKSIKHEEWMELTRPKPDHLMQLISYWRFHKEKGYRMASRGTVLYVSKGFLFKGTPYKEFSVQIAGTEQRLQPYLDSAMELVRYRETGKLPTRVLCRNESSPMAKQCHVCGMCFREE